MKLSMIPIFQEIMDIPGMTAAKAMALSHVCLKWIIYDQPLSTGDGIGKFAGSLGGLQEMGLITENRGEWSPKDETCDLFIRAMARSLCGVQNHHVKKLTEGNGGAVPDGEVSLRTSLPTFPLVASYSYSPNTRPPHLVALARGNSGNSEKKKDPYFLELLPQNWRENPTFLVEWKGWINFRRKSRKYPSEEAINLNLKDMKDLSVEQATQVVHHSWKSQYQGLFPERFTGTRGSPVLDMNALSIALGLPLPETEVIFRKAESRLRQVLDEVSDIPVGNMHKLFNDQAALLLRWLHNLPSPKAGESVKHRIVERAGKSFTEYNPLYVEDLRKRYFSEKGIDSILSEFSKWILSCNGNRKKSLSAYTITQDGVLWQKFLRIVEHRTKISFKTGKATT